MRKINIYNTMSRKIEEFVPINENHVGMYGCGPTVYNYAHVGNLRTFLFEDFLKRMFIHFGYDVFHVMNITDVGHLTGDGDEGEDKLQKSARETGKSVWDIAEFYTKAFFKDYDSLNIERPNISCRATDHIQDMINLIKRLEESGHTYISGGNVYFSIDTFPEYGKLARLDTMELRSGARIDVDTNKKNPKDFVLWFTNSKFGQQEMMWDSPWGRGYPGWHIECSAMSMKYLGESFDIHCGGIDAIPVHHTNEIAQSEAAIGHKWVNYWMHGEFLLSSTGKMSKSKGEFLTMSLLQSKGYDPMDYRYFCLGGHYRSQLQFSYEALDSAKKGREGLYNKIAQLRKNTSDKISPKNNIGERALYWKDEFDNHISTDLNMPRAIADLWSMLKDRDVFDAEKLGLIDYMDEVLGLKLDTAVEEKVKNDIPDEVLKLLEQRTVAKKEKKWNEADLIRDKIANMGYIIKDTADGPTLKKKL